MNSDLYSDKSIQIGGPENKATIEIVRQARDFSRQKNVEAGILPYGDSVIHNGPPYNDRPNEVEYDISFTSTADYQLEIEYAALVSRPCKLTWDRSPVASARMGETTGGWDEDHQKWIAQGVVAGKAGIHTLRIASDGVFPHIRTIKLTLLYG